MTWLELIDTLWNVNGIVLRMATYEGFGINRYIMECKWKEEIWNIFCGKELIDTLWNVNVKQLSQVDMMRIQN